MSTNTPATRRGRPKTERMLQIARQILAILTQDHPQSVRHVFYRLLDPTLPLPLPKTEAGYKCVQRALVDLCRSGQVPYSWISDATRWGHYVSAYQHAADALQAAYAYRVDLWSQADTLRRGVDREPQHGRRHPRRDRGTGGAALRRPEASRR